MRTRLRRHLVDDLHHVEGLDLLLEVLRLDAVGEHGHAERARDGDDLGIRRERLIPPGAEAHYRDALRLDAGNHEIEGVADTMLKEVSARSVQTLENQMDEATGNMRIVQKGIIASVSESLKAQAAEALQEFEHSMHELAQLSIERWRQRLATGLNVMVRKLEEQF